MGKRRSHTPTGSATTTASDAPATDFGDNSTRLEEMIPSSSGSETPALDASGAGGLASAGDASTLELELRAALANGPNFAALDAMVANADPKERQLAYRSDGLHQAIAASALSPAEQLALSTALAEGSLTWAMPVTGARSSDFYEYFGTNDAKGPPPPMNEMNCYEFVLYSAWRLGQISTEWIVEQYDNGELKVPSYEDLGYSDSLPKVDAASGATPAVGEFVFVISGDDASPWHAMLSLGGDNAVSLWKRPTRDTPASRVKLSEIAEPDDTLRYGPPSWH